MKSALRDKDYLQKLVILYVEDNEELFKTAVYFLSELCGTLLTARDGTEGLAVYHARHPDLIITDILMPVMDGLVMAAEIRKLDKTVPIIALTALENTDYLMRAINIGFNKYVTKPVNYPHLAEILVEYAHRFRVERQFQESEQRFQQLFDNSADGNLLICDGVFIDCNRTAERMFHVGRHQICGKSCAEFSPEFQPDGSVSREAMAEHSARAVLQGSTSFEWVHERSDGSCIWTDISLSAITMQGKQILFSSLRDITKRKQLEFKIKSITDTVSDAIIILGDHGEIEFVNPAAVDVFGYETQEMLGKNLHNLLTPPRYHAESSDALALFKINGTGQAMGKTLELAALRKDGQEIIIELTLSANQQEGEWYAIGVIRNITERHRSVEELKRAHEEILKTNNILDGILENMSDWAWEVDAQGRYTFCSDHVIDHLGYTPQELLGKSPFDLMSPEESARVSLLFSDIWRAKSGFNDLENWNISKDGQLVLLSSNGVPILAENGDLIGYRGVDKNITTIHFYEIKLRKLSRAIDQCTVAVIITDCDGIVEFVNPYFTATCGYSAEEAIGSSLRILKSGLTPPETYEKLWSTIKSGQTWEGELINKHKDGSLFNEQAIISPIRDEQGNISHFVAIKEDVTARHRMAADLLRAKEQAEEGSRAKSEFLATISHEMRTPMNGVIGMIQILLDTELTEDQREYVDISRKCSDHMMSIIEDIFDYSDIKKFKLNQKVVGFNLRTLVLDTIQMQSGAAQEKGLQLTYAINPEVPFRLKGDPKLLCQIITNLLSNAIKFTAFGQIEVSVRVQIDQMGVVVLRFEVKDTGIGIADVALQRVFEPFTQGDSSSTRRYEGMGMGLAICRHIAYLMGGDIGVSSEEGVGSTFWFSAMFERDVETEEIDNPEQSVTTGEISLAVPSVQPPVTAVPVVTPVSSAVRILLVEDNVINQKVALNLLSKIGYNTDVVENGLAAVNALRSVNYDLVLMDCLMPVMGGLEATGVIRDPASAVINHRVPIVAVTANVLDNDRECCLNAGMDDYLSKPLKKDILNNTLEKWLKQNVE